MTLLAVLLVLLATVGASSALTRAVLRYAVARSILDIPNQRSAHLAPVPRGGGVAIVTVTLTGIALGGLAGWMDASVVAALLGGGVLVAGVGLVDDQGHVAPVARALVHFAAASWAIAWLGGFPQLSVGFTHLHLGVAGAILALVGIVWVINLFNFMDGIDGVAGGEAVSIGLIGGALLLAAGDPGLAATAVLVASASAGFLVWNWTPARIFMGDVGSGTLGFFFAVIAVASEKAGALPVLGWGLLGGVFIFDATVTLVRRLLRGERWYEAHHSHAYQRLVQAGWTHARVTGVILVVNAALGALSAVGWLWPRLLIPALLIGGALLTWLYVRIERLRPMGTREEPVIRR